MDSLAQTTFSTPDTGAQRNRFVGWSTIVSGVALIIVSEKPYFPASLGLFMFIASLALFLGMFPVAIWLADGTVSRAKSSALAATIAKWIGIAGALIAIATALLVLPRWLPATAAQILETSSLGVVGLWLLAANALAFRARLLNRVLATLGAIAGACFFLSAAIMWVELSVGNLGSAVSTLENIRIFGLYLGDALYIIWTLWLGIWLLMRRKR